MDNITDTDLEKIIDLSINLGITYLKWAGLHEKLTIKQIQEKFDCCDELIKILDNYGPEKSEGVDSNRLVVIVYEYLNDNFSQNHAILYRTGFAVAQQTLGLAARFSSQDKEDSGKDLNDMLPRHMEVLKDRLNGMLPSRIIKSVIDITTNKIEEAGLEIDISDLLVEVFNKVAFQDEGQTLTVTIGEEQKTFQTFKEMIGCLLNYSVETFTKRSTSVESLNSVEKFKKLIGDVTDDFLSKNRAILNVHSNDFIEELSQGEQVDISQLSPSVDELVLGAIGGMAEGFWLAHKQQYKPPK